ncbi:Anaerobic benzoate catabolism transcriptional regulator [Candidatus Desulfarcum epimagneticum]|uniref:Anaerobic benzoate catabolism transcriptional regulator n=1 Tax=uncultured Desulfobacteraceae bacterium TaxID=218296 RepID=A0A484HHW2_9BACT|nr:Anaerobic benzoate catabolism transcriptional regulator [uncultured Desulfobacteraceae bacterium]
MKKKKKGEFPLGAFLKSLRKKKGVSLREVEKATGIPNAYLSQLENGERRKIPEPERLKKMADYYVVSMGELLQKAGYFGSNEIEETYEQKIDKAFLHVVNDPTFNYGTRLKGKPDLETKRFIIEMYEKFTNKKILENAYQK